MQHRPRTGAKQSSTRPKPGDAAKQKDADAPPPQRRQHPPKPRGGDGGTKRRGASRASRSPRGGARASEPPGGGRGRGAPATPPEASASPRRRGARTPHSAPEPRASEGRGGAKGRGAERSARAARGRRKEPLRADGATSTRSDGGKSRGEAPARGSGRGRPPAAAAAGRAWRAGKGAATERAAPRRERIHFNPPKAIKAGGGTGRKGGPPPKRPARCAPDNLHSAKASAFYYLI